MRGVRTVACGVSQLVGTVLAQAGSARQTALAGVAPVAINSNDVHLCAAIRCGFERVAAAILLQKTAPTVNPFTGVQLSTA